MEMTVRQVKELMPNNEVIIETMDAECRCVDYIDVDAFLDKEVTCIFAYNDRIYLRVDV